MTIEEIRAELTAFRETIIIGNANDKERVNSCYSSLSPDELDSKPFKYVLCGDITELFLSKLRTKGHDGKPIFIWSQLLENQHDIVLDSRYINAIADGNTETVKEYENTFKFNAEKDGTHGIFETSVNGSVYTIDAKVGLIYNAGIQDLVQGKGIYESWRFLDQFKYIRDSYHMGRSYTHVYATAAYWSHIKSFYYTEHMHTRFVGYFLKEQEKHD